MTVKKGIVTVTMNPALDKTVTVENFEAAKLNRIQDIRLDPGGKGINVARVLKRFDTEVMAWGLLGGLTGRLLAWKLEELGIPSDFLEVEGETRTNLKVVDKLTGETTEINEPGVQVGPETADRFLERFESGISDYDCLLLGGSLPPGLPEDWYRRLISIAKSKGVPALLDADGKAFHHGIEAAPWAIKPNIHELEGYCGRKLYTFEDMLHEACKLIDKGIGLVQISMGGDGSLLTDGREAFLARPFPITPASTVGAGDSMVAALAYGLLRGLGNEEMARLASAAGTVTASKPGTQVCSLEEIMESAHLVQIHNMTV